MTQYNTLKVIRDIAEYIAGEQSHAYRKHMQRMNEFNSRHFGGKLGIETPADLVAHAIKVMTDMTTEVIHLQGVCFYCYHAKSRTVAIVRENGTIFRRFPDEMKCPEPWYQRYMRWHLEALEGNLQILEGGLLRYLQKNPMLCKDLAEISKSIAEKEALIQAKKSRRAGVKKKKESAKKKEA